MDAGTDKGGGATDDDYQRHILAGVSRTFALTIPQLPAPLCRVVSNGYLLCRIADTIEDDAGLEAARKRRFSEQFIRVVAGEADAGDFVRELHPALAPGTPAAEAELIRNTERVLRITHSFNDVQRGALARCVRIMSRGMAEYQENATVLGLQDLTDLDRYCYHVAGVVGEMLTELFCDHFPELRPRRDVMMKLAVSFGQGLQMTNILKDIWEDRRRGACWLPRDLFRDAGFNLADLRPGARHPGFAAGMTSLIGVARMHLEGALNYTTMLPRNETGLRRFCLWAIGMAVLTLRKIHRRPDFASGAEVKISRRSVRATVLVTSVAARQDSVLRLLFDACTRSLPAAPDLARAVSAH